MKGERQFRRTVLLTALAGQFAYAIAAAKPGLVLVALFASLLSWWLVRQTLAGKTTAAPRVLLNGLVIAAILHLLWQLMGRTQEVITSLTDFLAYVMLVKALDRQRMRDEAQLLGLSLFVVIGALLTGQSLAMGLALMAYTPLAITATVSLQLYAARERQRELFRSVGLSEQAAAADAQLERQRAPRSIGRIAAACVLCSMATGVVAFVITPRQLAQQLGMATAPFVKSPSTDFSDQITLGSQGNISQDNTPVMDVRLVPDPSRIVLSPGPIYLRGAILTQYDAKHHIWTTVSRTGERDDRPPAFGDEPSQARRLVMLPDSTPLSLTDEEIKKTLRNPTEYEIIQRSTKPGQEALLFAPFQPVIVKCDADAKLRYRKRDATLRMSPSPGGRLVYQVTSVSDIRDPNAVAEAGPPESVSTPIRELAASLLTQRGLGPTPYQAGPLDVRRAAQAIVTHLGTFEYSLEMIASEPNEDPIDMFLFRNKRGHCEYFAAAMVQLLKAMGVPARIATGYVAAEYNSVSGYFTVRKSDAHAWVEVEMEPGRWETFDPTPPGELQSTRRAGGGPVAWLKHLWDAIEFSWLDNVVAYDKGLKLDVGALAGRSDPGEAAMKWQNRIRAWQAWIREHLPQNAAVRSIVVGLVTFAAVLGVYGLVRLLRRSATGVRARLAALFAGKRSAAQAGIPIPADAAFYGQALAALAAAGLGKPGAIPPLAFAESLGPEAGSPFGRIAALYYRSRFGQSPLDVGQQAEGTAALADLRAALSPKSRQSGPRTST